MAERMESTTALKLAEESFKKLADSGVRLQRTGSPNLFCSSLPPHWRSNKSLQTPFIVLALDPVPEGTKVAVYAGNEENCVADVKNNTATFTSQMARFSDLRFIGKSGRGKYFNLTIMIYSQPALHVVTVLNAIKVTVDGPRDSRNPARQSNGHRLYLSADSNVTGFNNPNRPPPSPLGAHASAFRPKLQVDQVRLSPVARMSRTKGCDIDNVGGALSISQPNTLPLNGDQTWAAGFLAASAYSRAGPSATSTPSSIHPVAPFPPMQQGLTTMANSFSQPALSQLVQAFFVHEFLRLYSPTPSMVSSFPALANGAASARKRCAEKVSANGCLDLKKPISPVAKKGCHRQHIDTTATNITTNGSASNSQSVLRLPPFFPPYSSKYNGEALSFAQKGLSVCELLSKETVETNEVGKQAKSEGDSLWRPYDAK